MCGVVIIFRLSCSSLDGTLLYRFLSDVYICHQELGPLMYDLDKIELLGMWPMDTFVVFGEFVKQPQTALSI
jgi:hypothetical protein